MQSRSAAGYVEPVVVAPDEAFTNDTTETWVLFVVDDQTYALQIWEIERIVRAVEVKPLPEVPPHIRGVVNVQGRVLPVVDLRVRFGHKPRPIALEDHFIIARTKDLSIILPVDTSLGSQKVLGGSTPDSPDVPRCVRKVVPLDLGVVYALDLQRVLFDDESPTESKLALVLGELQST